ncbi:DUF1565 domain-containing protein [Patescibacteria group bacterium]|nr:DUF1565 domain-containing protein [Patescibacteria group bacterium]
MKNNIIYLVFIFLLILIVYSLTTRLFEKTLFVSTNGSDNNSGTFGKPLRSIQYAVNIATAGTTIHILPGTYRESVTVSNSGTKDSPITLYVAPSDRGKVILEGSELSSQMIWHKCNTVNCKKIPVNSGHEVFFTHLDWNEIPYQIYENISGRDLYPLRLARTPNYNVTTDWKFHQNWWTSEDSSENNKVLSDHKLKNIGDINGATINLIDGGTRCGEFSYSRVIDNFNGQKGQIIFDQPVGFSIFGSQENGISQYTKYYVENKPQFLDEKGEWFYDKKSGILYIWPLEEKNPKNLDIEISKRSFGLNLSKASNFIVDGLTIKYINESDIFHNESSAAIIINPEENSQVKNIKLVNLDINHSSAGITISSPYNLSRVENISLTKSKIDYIDKNVFVAAASSQFPSNVSNITINDSDFGFSSFQNNDIGLSFVRVSNIKLVNNKIHDFANYPIVFTGFERNDGTVKNLVIENNFINNNCLNLSACSSIKIYGGKFLDTLIKNNIMENNKGWSYCQEAKYGQGYAHGIFISNASGITVQNNIILNMSDIGIEIYPRQIPTTNNYIINNLISRSSTGINLGNPKDAFDLNKLAHNTRHDGDIIKNNIFLNNNTAINIDPADSNSIAIDYSAYINNKNDMIFRNDPLISLNSIRNAFPKWDIHSIETNTQAFRNAKSGDFNLYYTSPLRGKGEPQSGNPWIQANLFLLGLANDIGPCKFSWVGNTCAVNGN